MRDLLQHESRRLKVELYFIKHKHQGGDCVNTVVKNDDTLPEFYSSVRDAGMPA